MIRHSDSIGKETRWSLYSLVSAAALVVLHSIHWLALPILLGAAAEVAHHHHGAAQPDSRLLQALTAAVWIVNAAGAYFAIRQLSAAWRGWSSRSYVTYLICAVSIAVLLVACYSILTLG